MKQKITAKTESSRRAVVEKSRAHVVGFKTFIKEQGVAGLAIGIVLGGAVTVVVKSLIDNIVLPPLGLILGSAEGLKGLTLNLGTTSAGKQAVLHYGTFLNDLINFLVIACVVYAVVSLLGLNKKDEK